MDLVDLVLWELPAHDSEPQVLEPEAVSQREGLGEGWTRRRVHRASAKGKLWFGVGRTPCPVPAQSICFICFLKQKEEQEAQDSVPVMSSADREMTGVRTKAGTGRETGAGGLVWPPSLHRMAWRGGVASWALGEGEGREEKRPDPVHSQKDQNERLENELEPDLPLLGPEP